MRLRPRWWMGLLAVVLGLAIVLLWPAPDPLADVDTVAIRMRGEGSSHQGVNYQEELAVVLGGRDIRIVADESAADLLLSLDDLRVNLGDIEISLAEGRLRGRASAVCTVTDLRSGREYTMDFTLRFRDGEVKADLVGRRFWEFWK